MLIFASSSSGAPRPLWAHCLLLFCLCQALHPCLSLMRTLVMGCRAHLDNPGCAHLKTLIISAKTPFQFSPRSGSGIGTWTCLGHHPAHSSRGRLKHGCVWGSRVQVGGSRVQHALARPASCAAGLGRVCLQPAGGLGDLDAWESTTHAENVSFCAFQAHSLIQPTLVPVLFEVPGCQGTYPA